MPWAPELFTAPAVQHLLDARRWERIVSVPYYDGFLMDEPAALVESFAGEPLVHDPVRGRVKGVPAFTAFVADTTAWLRRRHASPEDVTRVIVPGHGFEELIIHVDGPAGRVAMPLATRTERREDERIQEIRVYHSNLPLFGRHGARPPLLQADPGLELPAAVAAHLKALAAGDAEGVVATFDPDGYVRGPDAADDVHRGPDALRAFYSRLLAGGGIGLEHCTLVGDGVTWALEYNVVARGDTALLPQAGVAMYVLSAGGRLAAVRVYDDVEPPPA
jgi:SnoaL-like domain